MDLYEINDMLSAMAEAVDRRSAFGSDEDYDMWLNELTHHVAQQMGVDE